MPNASHAQFAYHQRPPAWTRYAVGTSENGLSMRISGIAGFSTSAWASCRRRSPASSSAPGSAEVVRRRRVTLLHVVPVNAVPKLDVALVHAPSLVAFCS